MTDMFVLPDVDEHLGMTDLARAALAHGLADAATDRTGHGPHAVRMVVHNARAVAVAEGHTDPDFIERIVITAALQDVADVKRTGDAKSGAEAARAFLIGQGAPAAFADAVAADIASIKFQGAHTPRRPLSAAGRIVQDAVWLASLGAIGICRAMAYGGAIGREMYDPDLPAFYADTAEAYLAQTTTSINHLLEKAARIPDMLNTATARRIAKSRHEFLMRFLAQFTAEWEGRA
ncbi:HD domain-containing protein [Glycomyces sp. MUSA5-2]|uniref:HD domain-containing protein n=1 Tax=Glycomyces sp. MUSA5-2 TaxID=2053002 RepID=UPI00300A9EEA